MITAYATNKDGQGFVQQIGEYEDIESVEIRIGIFSSDTVITFETTK